jgi:hypothetical protein
VVDEAATIPYQKEIRRFLRNEPLRSRRVLKLIFANWLAECDQAPDDRPAFLSLGPGLFQDPKAPPSARALSPDAILDWYTVSELSKLELPPFSNCDAAFHEQAARAGLVVSFAEQWFLRDHKRMPNSTDELVGLYLKRIPLGYVAEGR